MSVASLLSSPADDRTAGISAAWIIAQIGRCNPQLECFRAEEYVTGFLARFSPEDAALICRQAFEVHRGMWLDAPVTPLRFQEGHDPFFAVPLLEEARRGDSREA